MTPGAVRAANPLGLSTLKAIIRLGSLFITASELVGYKLGHRMELYVNPKIADKIIEISKSFEIDARVIGRVEACETRKLSIYSESGNFEY